MYELINDEGNIAYVSIEIYNMLKKIDMDILPDYIIKKYIPHIVREFKGYKLHKRKTK